MKPEFSRPFPTDKLRDRPMQEKLEANEEECADLAKRLDIVAINSLKAEMTLTRAHGDMVEVKGYFEAVIVQNCVVTLEPFESTVREEIEAYFAPASTIPDEGEVEVDSDRSPEAIGRDGMVDLGELTAQHLSLALDPYPRKPGVVFQSPAETQEKAKVNPFAVLAGLKGQKDPKKR